MPTIAIHSVTPPIKGARGIIPEAIRAIATPTIALVRMVKKRSMPHSARPGLWGGTSCISSHHSPPKTAECDYRDQCRTCSHERPP